MWHFTQGTQSLHHPRWPSHSFCEQVSHRHRDTVCQHWEGTLSHCVWLWEVRTYLYGRTFTVETDHKLLEMISMKNLIAAPARLQRMLLWLQQYDDNYIQTRQGNAPGWCPQLSSFMDWHTDPAQPQSQCHIHFSLHKEPSDKDCSRNTIDPILSTVHRLTLNGWPNRCTNIPRITRNYWISMMNSPGWSTHERWMSHHPTILQETLSWMISTKAMQESTRHWPWLECVSTGQGWKQMWQTISRDAWCVLSAVIFP